MNIFIGLIIYLFLVWFMCKFFKVTARFDNTFDPTHDEHDFRNIRLDMEENDNE